MDLEDIDEFIKARDKYYQIVSKKDDQAFPSQPLGNLEVTQENVHLLIPSKLSWMANMLAEDKGISIVDAILTNARIVSTVKSKENGNQKPFEKMIIMYYSLRNIKGCLAASL